MRIPHTIDQNFFKQYEPSKAALDLVPESKRTIKAEDRTWDDSHPLKLMELSLMVIVANFENRIILNELPCWNRNTLLEMLPTDLPLPLVIKYIHEDIYWKRKVHDTWEDNANYCQDYGFDWKRMFLERHVQAAVEAMTPEGFDLESVEALCDLSKDYVRNLDLRELQIMRPTISMDEENEFNVVPEPSDHIDLGLIISGLVNLTELHVQFGLRNVGSEYKKSWFQFSLQDCRNLGMGVAVCKNLRLLRVHSCSLDDDRLIMLLSNMEENKSLEELDFSNCLVGDDGATGLAKYLRNRGNIKKVNLCNNKIGENGISALAFVITQSDCSPLEYLNLKFNSFGDAGLKFLASGLVREHAKIKVLKISCCGLGVESGILLGEMLNRNSIITDIDVSNNRLEETGGRALAEAMEKNTTIQFLDIRMTGISDEDLLSINQALHFNRIRTLKGEKGIVREIELIRKRAEEARIRQEEEEKAAIAKAAAAKAAEEEKIARLEALKAQTEPNE